jgi:hypothetical protein
MKLIEKLNTQVYNVTKEKQRVTMFPSHPHQPSTVAKNCSRIPP